MTEVPVLETARLRLRPRTAADLENSLEMDLDPAVHRYIFVDGPPDPEAHRAVLAGRMDGTWPPVGGVWVVAWRDDPRFLGWCGLFPLEQSGLIEIGYRLVRRAWGQGVATEAARAVLDYGFTTLGLDTIVAVSHPENTASHRVLGKIGLRREGLQRHYGLDLAFFRLRADEHRAGD